MRSSIEECFEAHGEPRTIGDRAHRQQDAGHERSPIEGVVTKGEHFSGVAEEHLFVRDVPADTHGVHAHPGDVGTARALEGSVRGVGGRRHSRMAPRFGDGLSRVGRCA